MKAVAAAIIIALVAFLLVGIQQYRVIALRADVQFEADEKKKAVDANAESQATISTLRAEAKRNADYTADLAKRINASEQKAKKARKDFEDLKRNSKPVRDWAAQPLPDGLRGKPAAAGNKDNSSKSRAP
jgi:LysB family phage lysis regulatory protein